MDRQSRPYVCLNSQSMYAFNTYRLLDPLNTVMNYHSRSIPSIHDASK